MKKSFLYLFFIAISICLTGTLTAQQFSINQATTPEYQAASAPNPNVAGQFATVGNSNGNIQFFQHSPGAFPLPSAVYFHPLQQSMEVIDMAHTKASCGLPEGYFITGNTRQPGVASMNIFVARIDMSGAPIWYKEFPIDISGTVKAIVVGQVPDATPNQPEMNRVFIIGSASNGVSVAASLDHCGTPAWGPFTYNTPNIPTFPEDLAFHENGNQVIFTGGSGTATGLLQTWIAGVNASTGMPNWFNNYPVNNGSGDNGTAVTVHNDEICVTGRANYNSGLPQLYTLKVGATSGFPMWQHVYFSTTSTVEGTWGEDVIPSSTDGNFIVIGRDGNSSNTFIHELDGNTGFPIAGSEFIYPLTVQSSLRDQISRNPLDAPNQYFISSNTASGSGDYHGIWTPMAQPLPCGPLAFPFDPAQQQSFINSDWAMDFLVSWEEQQLYYDIFDIEQVDPCGQVEPCEVTSDFCFDVNIGNVTFTNNSTGNGILTYEWDFGDGNTSTAMNPSHTYPTPSSPTIYVVCMTVTNTLSDGTVCCYTCCTEITIYPPCYNNIAGPTFNYLYKNNGSIKFNNPSGVGGAFTKEWTIDGSYHSNLNQPPSITLTPGFHEVCLEVTKNSNPNCSEKFCRTIWVDEACTVPTTAKITYATCLNSTTVDLEAIAGATNGSTNYTWDFGDGNTGSGMNVTHTYGTYGSYMVCVTIENTPNCSKKACAMIVIAPPSCSDSCSPSTRLAGDDVQDAPFDKWNDGTDLQIMPNPISTVGTAVFSEIQSEKATVIISDMSGKTISQNSIQKGTRNYEFDMSDLPSGMYIITLQHPDGKMTASKIIKE